MKEFTILTSTVLPLRIDNIDTDQIIPARFLKAVGREGFGEKLFYDWRFDKNGKQKITVFSNKKYTGAKILVAGDNFGVGSSREHAAWAIHDYGFRVVIAINFGDIFYNNAVKNGLLLVHLPKKTVEHLFLLIEGNPKTKLTADLPNQHVTTETGEVFPFDINLFRKTCLIKGVDDLGYLLNLDKEITEFEMNHRSFLSSRPSDPPTGGERVEGSCSTEAVERDPSTTLGMTV